MYVAERKSKIMPLILFVVVIVLVTGFSYAFFIFNKTGLYTHSITGGKMRVIYDEIVGNNITIENAYPRTDEEALTYGLEFEFTITGYNESDKNIYYAIEIDHGEDVNGKTRFLDRDIKLTLYENDEVAFENEIFENLDNQDIYYNYFKSGTSSQSPMINNYKMRIWINDNVIISDTIEDTISSWDEMDWRLIEDKLEYDDLIRINNNEVTTLSELGISVYTSDEFANNYANFKVNVRADLTYDDIGYLIYDANGGDFTPSKTSLTTNMVTTQKPVMEGKGFLGWSSNPDAIEPEYKSGDTYTGTGQILYAVYNDTRNFMNTFSSTITSQKSYITEVYFINDTEENIDARYNESLIKEDLTYNNQGRVLGWLENDYYDEINGVQYYKLYVGSNGATYLRTGYQLFMGWTKTNKINFDNIDTSQVTDMSGMFSKMSNIIELDLNAFNVANVTSLYCKVGYDYYSLFSECRSLMKLNLSSFNINSFSNMSYMFSNCSKLTTIDLSNFDTSDVVDMSMMFYNCSKLTALDLSNFDTSKATNMSRMFYDCWELKQLNVSSFDTKMVTNMSWMFGGCYSLTLLDTSVLNTKEVTNMSYMFYNCGNIEKLDLSNFNTSKVTDMSGMFYNCGNIEKLDLGNFDTARTISMGSMFKECVGFTTAGPGEEYDLNLKTFDTSKVTNMSFMFQDCVGLTKIDLSHFDTSNVTLMSNMFDQCIGLKTAGPGEEYDLNLSGFNTENVTYMGSTEMRDGVIVNGGMFEDCSNLTKVNLSHFDTGKVISMANFFSGCTSLVEVDLSHFVTSSVTIAGEMFENCKSLEKLDLSSFDTTNMIVMTRMFSGCSKLAELDISNFTFNDTVMGTSYNHRNMFYNMPTLAIVKVNDDNEKVAVLSINSKWTSDNIIIV